MKHPLPLAERPAETEKEAFHTLLALDGLGGGDAVAALAVTASARPDVVGECHVAF